jgi:20S proteasome alpha/beta subunit
VKAYLLVVGVDPTGAHLYEVSASGAGYFKPFSADGSGSLCAMAELENGFKPDMTVNFLSHPKIFPALIFKEDECRKLVMKSVEAGMHGDDSSGLVFLAKMKLKFSNHYFIATFTKEGKKMEGPFTPTFSQRPDELEGKYIFEPGTT